MSEDQIEDVPIGTPSPSPYEDDADLPDSADFAGEHDDTTAGDEADSRETESPRGRGGMDTPPNPLREV